MNMLQSAVIFPSEREGGLLNPYSSPRGRLEIVPSPPRIQIDAQQPDAVHIWPENDKTFQNE